MFIKTLKSKIYKRMTANDSKSYLPYLNKIVDQYSNTYHHSIHKKPTNAHYSASTENIESNFKASKFKVNDRVIINSVLKLLLGHIKSKILTEKNNRKFLWKRIVAEYIINELSRSY